MAIIVSSLVFVKVDQMGNPHTEAYCLIEFRDARYTLGGEAMDLSAIMRRVEVPPMVGRVSGVSQDYEVRPNVADYPGNAGSGRLELYYANSGIVTLNISGIPIQILSGSLVSLASGMSNAGSGRIGLVSSGDLGIGLGKAEILSGTTSISGIRAMLHLIGQ